MNRTTFDTVSSVLRDDFKVEPQLITPEATLDQIGLDSLGLMEFVFAVEDKLDVRIPEDKLDPRQAGITLGRLCELLDEAVATRPATDAAVG